MGRIIDIKEMVDFQRLLETSSLSDDTKFLIRAFIEFGLSDLIEAKKKELEKLSRTLFE